MTDNNVWRSIEDERRRKCRNCVHFDGVRICGKYRMIAEPFGWCKSFRMKRGGKYEAEEKSRAGC